MRVKLVEYYEGKGYGQFGSDAGPDNFMATEEARQVVELIDEFVKRKKGKYKNQERDRRILLDVYGIDEDGQLKEHKESQLKIAQRFGLLRPRISKIKTEFESWARESKSAAASSPLNKGGIDSNPAIFEDTESSSPVIKKLFDWYFAPKFFEKKGKIYELLGIKLFSKIIINMYNNIPIGSGSEHNLLNRIKESESIEKLHLMAILPFTLLIMLSLNPQPSDQFNFAATFFILINIFGNLYPIMLQRYVRVKILNIIKRRAKKMEAQLISEPGKIKEQTGSPLNRIKDKSLKAHNNPGGIDFHPDYLDIQTQGNGLNVSSPLNMEAMENIEINGLVPFIFNITPVNNLPQLLGVTKKYDTIELSLLEKKE